MKAVWQQRYGGPDTLVLRNLPRPQIAQDQVLVKVAAAAFDPGVWHLMTGRPLLIRLMGFGLLRPKAPVIGTDLAGTAVAVGSEVTRIRPGDAVFGQGQGAFARFAAAPAGQLARLPAGLAPAAAAAAAGSACVAWRALHERGDVRPGHRVLVIGASGGAGTFAVQLAKAAGAHVTGVCSREKMELVQRLGADRVIDYRRDRIDEPAGRYDLLVDFGGNRPLAVLRRALKTDGTAVIVGGKPGRWFGLGRQLRARLIAPFVSQKLATPIFGPSSTRLLVCIARLLEERRIVSAIDGIWPLGRFRQAMERWAQGMARGKIVITLDEDDGGSPQGRKLDWP